MTLEQQVHKLEVRVRELERAISRLVPGRHAAQYVHDQDPKAMQAVIDKIRTGK